nr:hypothetical protein [Tanacetum cinerariifolium]
MGVIWYSLGVLELPGDERGTMHVELAGNSVDSVRRRIDVWGFDIIGTVSNSASGGFGGGHGNDGLSKSDPDDSLLGKRMESSIKDKKECDVPVCENSPICDDHSDILSDSNNDDDISSDDDDFEDIEYVEASLPDPKIIVLHEKLLSINHLFANIESLNDNPTPDRVLNSYVSFPISEESNNSISDNFLPEFKTFCDHTEETRSGITTTHVDDSLSEYDSFCFDIEPDQERLINVVKNDISDDSSNDPLLEEADLFLASDNSIPQGTVSNSASGGFGGGHGNDGLSKSDPDDSLLGKRMESSISNASSKWMSP